MKKNIRTPLRYPGGKSKLYNFVRQIIKNNCLNDKKYVEPFAGGFGIGIKLMLNNDVNRFIINDLDYHIYAFWKCVFSNKNSKLINLLKTTKISIKEWHKQHLIYENYKNYSILEVAFSTLFLNRTNFSGILSSGPIGGFSQKGKYKMDCRFNVNSIIEIITILAKYRNKVKVYNFDVKELILKKLSRCQDNVFINFDPPYVIKGKELYHNSYIETDHKNLRNLIKNNVCAKWIMTYDRNNLIKNLYSKYHINTFSIKYFVNKKYVGNEYLISNFFNSDLLSSKLK